MKGLIISICFCYMLSSHLSSESGGEAVKVTVTNANTNANTGAKKELKRKRSEVRAKENNVIFKSRIFSSNRLPKVNNNKLAFIVHGSLLNPRGGASCNSGSNISLSTGSTTTRTSITSTTTSSGKAEASSTAKERNYTLMKLNSNSSSNNILNLEITNDAEDAATEGDKEESEILVEFSNKSDHKEHEEEEEEEKEKEEIVDSSDPEDDKSDDDSEIIISEATQHNGEDIIVVADELIISSSEEDNRQKSFDDAFVEALQQLIYLPPSNEFIHHLRQIKSSLDLSSRKRLDRRSLYGMLLLEFLPPAENNNRNKQTNNSTTTTTKRTFLNEQISRALKGAISLASQPQWRKHLASSSNKDEERSFTYYYPKNIKFYPDQVSSSSDRHRPHNEEEENFTSNQQSVSCTMSMQETVSMALAHSLGCGFVIIDDAIIHYLKNYLLNHTASINQEDLKTSAILSKFFSIMNSNKLSRNTTLGNKISNLILKDIQQSLDDDILFNELANASYSLQIQNEKFSSSVHHNTSQALPCVFFIRTSKSNSILKSKSTVDVILKEMSGSIKSNEIEDDSIHLYILGKDYDYFEAPNHHNHHQQQSIDEERSSTSSSSSSFWSSTPPSTFVSSPSSSPSSPFQINENIMTSNMASPTSMNNASGQNDPAGSKRVNIFLARTLDNDGNPGIIGTIAPPNAGNIFPQMLAMHQQRQREEREKNGIPHVTNENNVNSPSLLFNTSISPKNTNTYVEQQQQPQQPNIPPEILQQIIQQAMKQMIDQLAQLKPNQTSSAASSPQNEVLKFFSDMLQNEHLKRGIVDNLIRAAPALMDQRCQGIMLSVYIPPGAGHPNRGMMPKEKRDSNSNTNNNGGGGWWNKILQPGAASTSPSLSAAPPNTPTTLNVSSASTSEASSSFSSTTSSKKVSSETKIHRNLLRLQSYCQSYPLPFPHDPIRSRSWEDWIDREVGNQVFVRNIQALGKELKSKSLSLSSESPASLLVLKNMLSIKDITKDSHEIVKSIIELEAVNSQRNSQSHDSRIKNAKLREDTPLTVLFEAFYLNETSNESQETFLAVKYIKAKSIETALWQTCKISPSVSSTKSIAQSQSITAFRSREEIASLAQDKHERALINQVVSPQDIGITYDMIGGLSDVKELLRQSITYPLKYPHLYSEGIAREAVKGVLLFGPPGTGKTMLAKAVATEGGATFLSIDASSVENKWLGESEKNAKAVFTLARRLAPCVIFLDEVDSLLSSREGSGSDDSAHGTLTSVKTTMMSEWDGLNSATNKYNDNRVIVIGSTNRPYDLDEAVLRRFPRRILVDLPDLNTRKEILEVTLADNRVDAHVNFTNVAERLEGYTGSDIKEVCREAVVQISHEQARLLDSGYEENRDVQFLRPVTMGDFNKALLKLKKSVSTKGKEFHRVLDWNDEYGEMKKKDRREAIPEIMNMFL